MRNLKYITGLILLFIFGLAPIVGSLALLFNSMVLAKICLMITMVLVWMIFIKILRNRNNNKEEKNEQE